MKKIILFLFFALPLMATAQKATPAKKNANAATAAKPPAQKTLSKADANAMVTYTNMLGDFMQQHLTLGNFISGIDRTSNSFIDNQIGYSMNASGNWYTFSEELSLYKQREGNDPTVIPKVIATVDATKIKEQFKICESSTQTLVALRKELEAVFATKKNGFIDAKKDKDAVDKVTAIVEKMNASLDSAYNAVDALYEVKEDIGTKAEEVILTGHPMKKEILDMKSVLRKARKMTSIITNAESADEMTTLLPAVEKLNEENIEIVARYANYNTKAKDYSIQQLKESVNYFFLHYTGKFLPDYEEFKKIYSIKPGRAEPGFEQRQEGMNFTYEGLLYKYNTFVAENNH